MNMQTAVQANILGMHLTGMLSKENNVKEFLVMPTPSAENTPMTVENICKEINRLIHDWNESTDPVSPNSPVDPSAVMAALGIVGLSDAELGFSQFFVYTKKSGEDAAVTEYAIGMYIEPPADKEPESGFAFLKIERAYINVWNTTSPKVLEKMKIWSTKDLLPA